MLKELNVQNLATLASVDLELSAGFIAITGDTGAGKSLVLDALELALGARADASLVRAGTERAQISASFDITQLPAAQRWLTENDLTNETELILRRTVTAEGRSKAYVNGVSISAAELKELADRLVLMHTQHASLQLTQAKRQQDLLDEYADHSQTRHEFSTLFAQWKVTKTQLDTLRSDSEKADAERDLLNFQCEELDALALKDGEFETLDLEQHQLASGESFLHLTELALEQLVGTDEQGIIAVTERLAADLSRSSERHMTLANAAKLLDQVAIGLSEAKSEIQHAKDAFELDPEKLKFVEERLALIFTLARKHRIEPKQLTELHQTLKTRLNAAENASDRIPGLEQEVSSLRSKAEQIAAQLTTKRVEAAKVLSEQITGHFADLGMEYARLTIQLLPVAQLTAQGNESVQFFFQPNPGQQGGPLSKIASGGELSRVGLAIQVITAAKMATPTIIFDEVDVGIGGKTAAQVGRLLKTLALNAQVLVVTHQPQVAGHSDAHLHIEKQSNYDVTVSGARLLTRNERINEIARMLGGHRITDATLEAAEELLSPHSSI
jgi:DNA repair protein RecN (Recombination protein N)